MLYVSAQEELPTIEGFDIKRISCRSELKNEIFGGHVPLEPEHKAALDLWSEQYARENRPWFWSGRRGKRRQVRNAVRAKIEQQRLLGKLQMQVVASAEEPPCSFVLLTVLLVIYYTLMIIWLWRHWDSSNGN